MNRLLIIEDEAIILKALTRLLERNHYEVTATTSVEEALEFEPRGYDLVLADLRLPGVPGTEIIAYSDPVPVVIMTSHASVRSAVDAMRAGAIDYIAKPFDHDELLIVIQRSLSQNRMKAQNTALLTDMERLLPAPALLQCTELGEHQRRIENDTSTEKNYFIAGERGVGREWLARLMHWHGERRNGPFVIADLPLLRHEPIADKLLGSDEGIDRHGMLHAAHGGTLVIRQPALLSHELQNQLAQIFNRRGLKKHGSERVFNIQLIVVSDTSLDALSDSNEITANFAELFKANHFVIKPLREQHERLDELVHSLIDHHSRRHNVPAKTPDPSAIAAVQAYRWDGNAQELDRSIERAVLAAHGRAIEATDLGLGIVNTDSDATPNRDLSLDEYFRFFVLRHQSHLSETELASRLGISRKALWERRQKMRLPRS